MSWCRMVQEVLEGNLQTNQEIQLEDCLQDIMSKKIDKYNVRVYGATLEERGGERRRGEIGRAHV